MEWLSCKNQIFYNNIFEYIIKTLEYMRKLQVIKFKCKSIDESLLLTEKKDLWNALQSELRKYKSFICNITRLTGIYVEFVGKEYYDNISAEEIKCQLEELRKIGYLKHALEEVAKDELKIVLKSIIKNDNKIITEDKENYFKMIDLL